jgi:hypothetical protein
MSALRGGCRRQRLNEQPAMSVTFYREGAKTQSSAENANTIHCCLYHRKQLIHSTFDIGHSAFKPQ